MGYVRVESGKIEAIKVFSALHSIILSFFRTSTALLIIQKQLPPVFLVIPSQYCLNCLVTSLRLHVSSLDNGLVVHAIIYFLLGFGIFLGASKKLLVVSCLLEF